MITPQQIVDLICKGKKLSLEERIDQRLIDSIAEGGFQYWIHIEFEMTEEQQIEMMRLYSQDWIVFPYAGEPGYLGLRFHAHESALKAGCP